MLTAPIIAMAIIHVLGCDVSRSVRDPVIVVGCALLGSAATFDLTRRWPAVLLYFVVSSAVGVFLGIPGLFAFGECK